jgi:hypothetical protein
MAPRRTPGPSAAVLGSRILRSFAWATRFRRLVEDHEFYASNLAGPHLVAIVCIMLRQAAQLAAGP